MIAGNRGRWAFSRSPRLSRSPAARAAARRAALRFTSIRAWTTSRRCDRRRPAPSSSTAQSMRQPVPGTVAIGGLKEDTAFFTGKGADGQFVATIPHPVDEALLERGRQRYGIYCQPCHDARGDGRGILFQRGNVPTATFHQDKILNYPTGNLRRHHQRGRTDARVSLADPSGGPLGDRRPRATSSSATGRPAPRVRPPPAPLQRSRPPLPPAPAAAPAGNR